MNNVNNSDILKNVSIFSDISEKELDIIASEMKKKEYKAGELIFKEGDPGDEMYVVIDGGVSIFIIDNDSKEVVLSEIMKGNFFGEMSIIERAPRSATCRVIQDSAFLVLHADDLANLIHFEPECAVKIMNKMLSITVERLMNIGAFVTQMVQWGSESRKRAITDAATGLFNRRYLEEFFDSLVNKAKAERSSLTFAMFDLDRFGDLNKKYGEAFCDKLIIASTQLFKNIFAQEDILVRYGGDEFVFIFPDTDSASAMKKCVSLCRAMRELRFQEHEELRLTCSIGFATLPDHASTVEELKDKSDKALYRAKEEGRDRVVGW
ncbi:MAG: GGDEF domain-containing protein [Leptospirales bacterium]|nr:GGDEF domain-containing protein [Leptospirales bacterium]